MAITLVGTAEASAINGGDATITLPSMLENDVVYIGGGFGREASNAGVSSAGWTELVDFNNGFGYRFAVSRKVMGASPDASAVCLGSTNASDACAYVAIVLRGVDTTTPEDATTTTATGTSGAPNSPSITTVTDLAWVLSFGGSLTVDAAVTAPTGYSNQVDVASNDDRDSTVGGATKEVTPAGAENPAAWTAWTSSLWCAASVAVRPGAAFDAATLSWDSVPETALETDVVVAY